MNEKIQRLHNILFVILTISIIPNDGYFPSPLLIVMENFDMPAWRALCALYGFLIFSKYSFQYILTGK
jgi:hypothetical protein